MDWVNYVHDIYTEYNVVQVFLKYCIRILRGMLKKTMFLAGISGLLLYTRHTALAIGIMSASPLFINYAQLYSEIKNYTTTYIIQRVFVVRAEEDEYDYHDSDYASSIDSYSSSESSSDEKVDTNVNNDDDLDTTEYEDYPRECDHDQLLYYLSKKLPNTDYAHAVRVLKKLIHACIL